MIVSKIISENVLWKFCKVEIVHILRYDLFWLNSFVRICKTEQILLKIVISHNVISKRASSKTC